MIYITFVELYSSMLHAKFQIHRSSGLGEDFFLKYFAIYGPGSHLGHVTWISYISIHYPFVRRLNMKFDFDWPSGFRGEEVQMTIYMDFALGQGQTTPWGQIIVTNINILCIFLFPAYFHQFNTILPIFPFKCIGNLGRP